MLHSTEQVLPGGLAVTEPTSKPLGRMARVNCGIGLNDADIVWLLLILKPQVVPVPPHGPPLQPSNRLPVLLCAVRLTPVPASRVTLQVPAGQLMPFPVTEPPPLTLTVNVTCAT